MDYKDVRKMFAEKSGRYDLVNDDWSDNGADFFINAGQKYLDRMQSTGKMKAKEVQSITAGTIIVKCTDLRAILEVSVGNTTDGLTALQRAPLQELRNFYEEQLSGIDRGTPIYYAPCYLRPHADTATFTGYYDIDDILVASNHYTYNGLILSPPPDETMYVSIYGLFYSPTLSATVASGTWTQTKSFWTEMHPDILLQAAFYKLEVFYRNTEGAKDWQAALQLDIAGLDHDIVEEDYAGINEMGG